MADDKYKWSGSYSSKAEAKLPQPPRQKPVDVYEQSTASKVGGFLKSKATTAIANAKAERQHNIQHKKALRAEYERGELSTAFKRGAVGNQPRSGGSYKMSAGRSVSSGDMFGAGMIGGGIGFDMFGGGAPAPRAPPPMRERVISPNGKVTIREPVMPQHKKESEDPLGSFWGSPNTTIKKGEKHPYDLF